MSPIVASERPNPLFLHSGRASTITIVNEALASTPTKEEYAGDADPTLSQARKWTITIVACLFTLLVCGLPV
jgi:hypothetical protein